MATKVGNGLDLQNEELFNTRLENLASDPAAGNAGRVFFNTASTAAKLDTGAAIITIGGSVDWADITGKPSTFPPDAHTHTASEVTDFATAVNTQIVAYWDSIAGTDADVDTIREALDAILANAAAITSLPAKFTQDIGDGSATSFNVTHSLGTRNVVVAVYDKGTNEVVLPDVDVTEANQITIAFGSAPTSNQYSVTVIG